VRPALYEAASALLRLKEFRRTATRYEKPTPAFAPPSISLLPSSLSDNVNSP
jgi:hypothetical protein